MRENEDNGEEVISLFDITVLTCDADNCDNSVTKEMGELCPECQD